MATAFNTTTYPLETSTKFTPGLGTKLDIMDDNSPRVRVMTSIKPIKINCVFLPQSESQSAAFEDYLYAIAAVDVDIVHNTKTYRGYIDGESADKAVAHGIVHYWSFVFVGRAV